MLWESARYVLHTEGLEASNTDSVCHDTGLIHTAPCALCMDPDPDFFESVTTKFFIYFFILVQSKTSDKSLLDIQTTKARKLLITEQITQCCQMEIKLLYIIVMNSFLTY